MDASVTGTQQQVWKQYKDGESAFKDECVYTFKVSEAQRRRSSNCSVSSEQPGWAVLTSFTQMNQKFKSKVCSLYSQSLPQICCLMTSFTRNIWGYMKTEVHSEVRVHRMFHQYNLPKLSSWKSRAESVLLAGVTLSDVLRLLYTVICELLF